MTAVLVTGGAGYVGSHACKALALAGYTPVTYDNLECGHEWAVKWGPFERGELADNNRLAAVMRSYRPAAVMHFAAYAYVGESMADPARYYRNNVFGTLALLEAMLECDVARIVFSSSCAVYGVPESVPIREDHAQNPINPYGAGKAAVERMLRDFDAAYGLRSVSLRYFNAAGADPGGEIGEAHEPETHLIPLVLDAALGRRADVAVFGDDYDTPDGTCIRDYVHVTDLAEAHVRAVKFLLAGGNSGSFNLGNGRGHSVMEVIAAARRVTAREITVSVGPRRPGDPPSLVSTADFAKRVLEWTPRRTSLETQIADAWRWHVKWRQGFQELAPGLSADRGATAGRQP